MLCFNPTYLIILLSSCTHALLCTHSFLFLQDGSNAFHLCAAGGNVTIAQFLAPMMEDHLFNVHNDGYSLALGKPRGSGVYGGVLSQNLWI